MMPPEDDFSYNLLLEQLFGSPMIAGPGFNKNGSPKDMTTGEQAKQGNLLQDILQMMTDPNMAFAGAAFGIPDGIDYNQFVEEQPVEQFVAPATPTYSAYQAQAANDPQVQSILGAVEQGMTRAQIAKMLSETSLSDDERKVWLQDVDSILKEKSDLVQAQTEWSARPAPERKLSPLEEALRKAGLPSPLETYDKSRYDGELGGLAQRSTDLRKKADEARAKVGPLQDSFSKLVKGRSIQDTYRQMGMDDEMIARVMNPDVVGSVVASAGRPSSSMLPQGGSSSTYGTSATAATPDRGVHDAMRANPDFAALSRQLNQAKTKAAVAGGNSEAARVLSKMHDTRARKRADVATSRGETPLNDAIRARLAMVRTMGLGI